MYQLLGFHQLLAMLFFMFCLRLMSKKNNKKYSTVALHNALKVKEKGKSYIPVVNFSWTWAQLHAHPDTLQMRIAPTPSLISTERNHTEEK